MANTSNTAAGRAAGSTAGAAASNMGPAAARRRGLNGGTGARGQDGGKGGRGRPLPQVRRRWRRRPGEAALAEIRTMQKSTELLISKAAISRLIREICQSSLGRKAGEDLRWTSPAIAAVHTAAEDYMTKIFESTNLLAIHAKHVTINHKGMQLAQKLCDE
eukprot:scaffold21384_cov37-Attheya_sp.AAC.1